MNNKKNVHKIERLRKLNHQKVRKGLIFVSFLLLPITLNYLSPYLALTGAAEGILNGSLIILGLLFLSSLFVGRFWCGWLCPAGGLQELCIGVRARDARGGRLNWIKYLFWAGLFGTVGVIALMAGGYQTFDFFYRTEGGVSIIHPVAFGMYYMMLGLIVVLSFVAGKRAFCHYLCWMAPFMIVGRKIRNLIHLHSLQLKADRDKCISCGRCSRECPMSLSVKEMVQNGSMENSECILCGSCVDICPKDAIEFSFSR